APRRQNPGVWIGYTNPTRERGTLTRRVSEAVSPGVQPPRSRVGFVYCRSTHADLAERGKRDKLPPFRQLCEYRGFAAYLPVWQKCPPPVRKLPTCIPQRLLVLQPRDSKYMGAV